MKHIGKAKIRKIIREEYKKILNESMYDVFSRHWNDEHTWSMVTPSSIMSVYDGMGGGVFSREQTQKFVDDLPYDWQKPKVIKTLQDAGKLSKSGGTFASSGASTSGDSGPLKTDELMKLMTAGLPDSEWKEYKMTKERLGQVNRGNLTPMEKQILGTQALNEIFGSRKRK